MCCVPDHCLQSHPLKNVNFSVSLFPRSPETLHKRSALVDVAKRSLWLSGRAANKGHSKAVQQWLTVMLLPGQKAIVRGLLMAAALLLLSGSILDVEAGMLEEEARKFPRAQITKRQWVEFFDEVLNKKGAVVVRQETVTRVVVRSEPAIYFFTNKSHPAHPAAVRRAVVGYAGKVYVHTSGYYAGDRRAFLAWIRQFTDEDRDRGRQMGAAISFHH